MSLIGDHIKASLQTPNFATKTYLEDLTDEQLMHRPHPKANHIAWQLGHLIASEHKLGNMLKPNGMPPLPEGFEAKHDKETAGNDNPSDFYTKKEYLELMDQQRAGTFALADSFTDEELQAPSPKNIQRLGATVGAVLAMQATHWMMHAGQWVIVRRQLGKEAIF